MKRIISISVFLLAILTLLVTGCKANPKETEESLDNIPYETEKSSIKQAYHYDAAGRVAELNLEDVDLNNTNSFFGVIYKEYPDFNVLPYNEEEQPIVFEQDGKYGYKDAAGNTLVEPIYDYAEPYQGGFAEASFDNGGNGVYAYFGMDGAQFDFDEIDAVGNGIALVKKDGKYGFINIKGDIIIPIVYDDIFTYDSELYMYAVKEDVGMCIDLTYGYEKTYELFDASRKELYDKVIDVKDYTVVIVDNFILINGKEAEKTTPLPLCIMMGLEFDTFIEGEGIIKQKGSLNHDGYYGPTISVDFEKKCRVAVPSYQNSDLHSVKTNKNTEKYQLTAEKYLLDSGIAKEGVITQCF